MALKETVIVYHGNCPDGFAGAYAAWKKFGDSASYVPAYHGEPVPTGLEGKEVFFIDFSYPKDVLLEIEKKTRRLVVLDHHSGALESVEAVKEHIFDNDRSGAGIAWGYFHPEKPLPKIIAYVQDNDLWKNSLPHAKDVAGYLSTVSFDFEKFDALVPKFEGEQEFKEILQKGKAYREYFDYVCEQVAEKAEEVQFDEFTILAVNAPRLFRSEIGHLLAERKAPFSIVWYPNHGMWHFSLRGDGSVDLSEIARRRGGNGHHNAASFRLPMSEPLPFTPLK